MKKSLKIARIVIDLTPPDESWGDAEYSLALAKMDVFGLLDEIKDRVEEVMRMAAATQDIGVEVDWNKGESS